VEGRRKWGECSGVGEGDVGNEGKLMVWFRTALWNLKEARVRVSLGGGTLALGTGEVYTDAGGECGES
jgi:hypothetical protein